MKNKKNISEQNPDARLRANTPNLSRNPTPPRRTTPPSPPRSTTPPVAVRPTHDELENLIKGKIIRPNNINITSADGTRIWNVSGVNFIVSKLMYCRPGSRHIGFFINLSEIDDEEKLKVDFMDNQFVMLFVENGTMRSETLEGEILRFEDPRFFKYLRENIFEKSFFKEARVNENKNTKKKVIRLTETQVKNLIGKIVKIITS